MKQFQDRQFQCVMICLLIGALGVVIFLLLAANLPNYAGWFFPPLLFCTGTLGASINNYRRLLTLGVTGVPDSTATQSDSATQQRSDREEKLRRLMMLQIVMSAVIGGFFGIVVYMMFVSELLKGDFFPIFTVSDEPSGTAIGKLINDMSLASAKDAAKAIVWSFVAGFSEQFVPNLLDKLAQSAESKVT